ncbi:MAG: OmpA family protein [Planctomycetota bacterium]|nr:OmpA family protein [Planctomycetota bacterium]
MNRMSILLAFVIVAGGAAITGCNDKCQQELTALKHQYNDLQLEKGDLQKSLMTSRNKNDELMTLLASKDSELDAVNTEIARLKSQPKPVPKPAVPAGWQETATGAKVTLASDILFAAGRARLSKQGIARLGQIVATIKTSYPDSIVRVYGFTDSDPIKKTKKLWTDNLDLSSNRAMAVVRLLQKSGIQAENLEAIGMGATHPVASNETREGKAKNRRVEIVVVK